MRGSAGWGTGWRKFRELAELAELAGDRGRSLTSGHDIICIDRI
jgi:hypothetical protein